MKYCPCCGEEYKEELYEICFDCCLPLLSGKRPKEFSHICGCVEETLGQYLTSSLEVGLKYLVEEEIREITGLKKEEHIEAYILKMKFYNTNEIVL